MTSMAYKMRDRIQFWKPVQDPVSSGGFSRSYETLIEVWAEVKPISHGAYIRGVQADAKVTHEINVRRWALDDLLRGPFSKAFSAAFKKVDVHPLKSEFFVFVLRGSNGAGDLMRVRRVMEVGSRRSRLSFLCEELEEQGSGWA